MTFKKRNGENGLTALAISAVLGLSLLAEVSAQTTVCAEVRLQIAQEATLEREAFDAALEITNQFPNYGLENFRVDVIIKDSAGNPADGIFFAGVNSKDGVTAVDGSGIVQPATTAKVHWLIIPSTGAGGANPLGLKYSVKADISYKLNGVYQAISTYEDYITVKPQPALALEYMLPFEVFADEPLTETITEPAEPFSLGVRVTNTGYGAARNFKLDSGRPEIADNKQGLAVDFTLLGAYVGGRKIADTLLVPFGDVAPGGVTQAAWVMSAALSGRFIKFDAGFSHADELGGQLTSLVQNVTTYTLLKDVVVDLPGRDSQFDFLVNTTTPRGTMYDTLSAGGGIAPDLILESDQPAPIPVERVAGEFSGALGGASTSAALKLTGVSASNAWIYTSIPAPLEGKARLLSAVRNDGKAINSRNVWISRHFIKSTVSYNYRLNLLDYDPPPAAEYALSFALDSVDVPPAAISDLNIFTVQNSTQAGLSWNATGEDGAGGAILGGHYLIQTATSAGAAFSPASAQIIFSTNTAPGMTQNYPLAGLMGNASHYFRLWLQDTGGSVSGDSNLAQLYVPPYPPADLVIGAASSSAVAAVWSGGNNNTPIEYSVRLDTDAFEPGVAASPFKDVSDNSFVFTGLAPNTTYLVYGQARSPESGVMSAQAYLGGAVTLAAVPGPLSASAVYVSSFTLAWAAGANPDGTEYLVQLSTVPDRSAVVAESGWVRAAAYSFSGLLEGTSYYAGVKARNSAGTETDFAEPGVFMTGYPDIIPPVPPAIAVRLKLEPETLNLGSKGEDITAKLKPESKNAPCFNRSTIGISAINGRELENSIYAREPKKDEGRGAGDREEKDKGEGGEERSSCGGITVKFDREAVIAVLPAGSTVSVTVSGGFADGESFSAEDTIRTLKPRRADPSFRLGGVYVSPNPAKGGAKPVFHIETGIADSVRITIYGASGRIAHEHTLNRAPEVIAADSGPVYAYEYAWEGRIGAGIYYYSVETEKAGQKLKASGGFAVLR